MQPENLPVPNGPEQTPANSTPNGERAPVLPTPEAGLEIGLERVEQAAEASAAAADAAYQGVPMPPPLPTMPAPLPPPVVSDSNPAIAADEDVIEKEWVDKAKQIILETKDDPASRSARVNELQKDYLKKRYNKDLGVDD